jgi:hypothetical protein
MSIEVQELDSEGHGIKFSTCESFEVLIKGDDYDDVQSLAYDKDITNSEALQRIIIEGMP